MSRSIRTEPSAPAQGGDTARDAGRRDARGGRHDDPRPDERRGTAADHGRDAQRPSELGARGWKDVFARVRVEAKRDNVTLLAAGVAFYGLLALVPGLVALLSMYGLLADPGEVRDQVVDALGAAPQEVRDLVSTQLTSIAEGSSGSVALGVIIGILLALWSASSGMGHLVDAINIAYDEEETRGWLKRKALALGLTVGAVLFLVVALGAIAVLPRLLDDTGLGGVAQLLTRIASWALLVGGFLVALAILYRYAPDRDEPRWIWVSPGAFLALALWLLGSIAFSVYTGNFGKYNETYGSLGAVVVLMLWLLISSVAIMLGAEWNAEMERQTARDTTTGPEAPLGERGAEAADTVGETAEQIKAARR